VRISIRELRDYLRCPLFYKLKNIDEIPVNKDINEYFKDYFKLALYFYYFSLIEQKPKSYESMLKRWGELWFSREMSELFSEEVLKQKSNEAVQLMSVFFKRFGTEKSTPIAVNFQYEAIFEGKENLHVTGEIDLIKILNDRTVRSETCLGFFNLSKHYPDTFFIKNDLTVSIASYAFRSNFKDQEDKIIFYNLPCSEDTPTLRTGNDFLRAEKAIRNITRAIQGGVFYPASNAISCGSCPYKMFCLNEKSINTGGVINDSRS
jgi:hypothetical protein